MYKIINEPKKFTLAFSRLFSFCSSKLKANVKSIWELQVFFYKKVVYKKVVLGCSKKLKKFGTGFLET